MFLTLAILLAAPPATDYADVRAAVANGMRVTVYAGVPLPTNAEPNAVRVDAIPGEPAGVYDCRKVDGKPVMTARVAATGKERLQVAPAVAYRDPPGTHRHRCPIDGTIWSHSPGGSHACPTCGRESQATRNHYTGPLPPTASKPVPVFRLQLRPADCAT